MQRAFLSFLLCFAGSACFAASSEDGVREAMDRLSQAMVKADGTALNALLHDKLVYSHSNARLESKADVLDSVTKSKTAKYEALTYDPAMKVAVYDNSAVVRTDTTVKNFNQGKPQTLKLNVLYVWVKDGNAWKLVARQSTRLPE